MDSILLAGGVLIAACGLWGIAIYNGLISARNFADASYSDVYVWMQKRANLIPILTESVKGYNKHEYELLERLTKLRTDILAAAKDAATGVEKANQMEAIFKSLFAVGENYPNLKASANFLDFQRQAGEMEDQIAAAWGIYNSNVRRYNTKLESIPDRFIAALGGFAPRTLFAAENKEAVAKVPDVKF